MSREYEYDPRLMCESCLAIGAYDIMGDAFCAECLKGDKKDGAKCDK